MFAIIVAPHQHRHQFGKLAAAHLACFSVFSLLHILVVMSNVVAASYNLDLNTASDYFPTVAEMDTYSSTENGGSSGTDPSTRPTVVPESSQQAHIEVTTNSGTLRGSRLRMPNGRIVNTFFGVPYAQAPLGPRRFQNVGIVDPWPGVRNATELPPSCWQAVDEAFDRFQGVEMWNPPGGKMDEDCLFANLWVPHRCLAQGLSGTHRCAVLVWIYGGSFTGGSATLDLYNGALLASLHHVIVISFNYRMGPFGFLYLGSLESAPGNMGLMDQQVALKWIHGNVEFFGGNKSQITLAGESAGAVSVSFHLFAKHSAPYFRNAILQSGSLFGPWTIKSRDFAKKRSLRLAEYTGCFTGGDATNVSMAGIAKCLQSKPARELTDKQFLLQTNYFEVMLPPIVDGYFLHESPQRCVEKGEFKRANLLVGANKDEGTYFLLYGLKKEMAQIFPKEPVFTRETYLNALKKVIGPNNKLLYEMTKYVYDDSKLARPSPLQVLNEATGDREFLCPTVRLAKLYSKSGSNVYMYHFTHRTSVTPWPEWMGVLHADEIEYVFGVPLRSNVKVQQPNEAEADEYSAVVGPPNSQRTSDGKFLKFPTVSQHSAFAPVSGKPAIGQQTSAKAPGYTYSEYRLSWAMTKFWTNFAKTDDPNIETRFYPPAVSVWPRFSTTDQKFIYFNTSRSYTIGRGLKHSECVYWEQIAEAHLDPSAADGGFGSESEAAPINGASKTAMPARFEAVAYCLVACLVVASVLLGQEAITATSTAAHHFNNSSRRRRDDGKFSSLLGASCPSSVVEDGRRLASAAATAANSNNKETITATLQQDTCQITANTIFLISSNKDRDDGSQDDSVSLSLNNNNNNKLPFLRKAPLSPKCKDTSPEQCCEDEHSSLVIFCR